MIAQYSDETMYVITIGGDGGGDELSRPALFINWGGGPCNLTYNYMFSFCVLSVSNLRVYTLNIAHWINHYKHKLTSMEFNVLKPQILPTLSKYAK